MSEKDACDNRTGKNDVAVREMPNGLSVMREREDEWKRRPKERRRVRVERREQWAWNLARHFHFQNPRMVREHGSRPVNRRLGCYTGESSVWRRRRLTRPEMLLSFLVAASHPIPAYAIFKKAAQTVPPSNMVANYGSPGQDWDWAMSVVSGWAKEWWTDRHSRLIDQSSRIVEPQCLKSAPSRSMGIGRSVVFWWWC